MLQIDGKEYGLKFNYKFAGRLVKDYSQDNVDGFDRLLGEIIDRDPEALVQAYRYALDVSDNKLPSTDKVADALEEAGYFNDGEKAFSDLFKGLKNDGFLALKLAHFMSTREQQVKDAKTALNAVTDKKQRKEVETTVKQAETMLKEVKEDFNRLSK